MQELKAAYSVAELAKMSGLSCDQVARIVEQTGLCGDRSPRRKRWIWLSDLKARCPSLWESILDRLSVMNTAKTGRGDEREDEFCGG